MILIIIIMGSGFEIFFSNFGIVLDSLWNEISYDDKIDAANAANAW